MIRSIGYRQIFRQPRLAPVSRETTPMPRRLCARRSTRGKLFTRVTSVRVALTDFRKWRRQRARTHDTRSDDGGGGDQQPSTVGGALAGEEQQPAVSGFRLEPGLPYRRDATVYGTQASFTGEPASRRTGADRCAS